MSTLGPQQSPPSKLQPTLLLLSSQYPFPTQSVAHPPVDPVPVAHVPVVKVPVLHTPVLVGPVVEATESAEAAVEVLVVVVVFEPGNKGSGSER